MTVHIPLHRPWSARRELEFVAHARSQGLSGNGAYGARAESWLERTISCNRAMLSHSCTAALELAALLAEIREGDEFILPSFTFPSTANAFVLRGATPVFVDIRPDTLNIDERLIEAAVTSKTRLVVPVHYAGVACDMDAICEIARSHRLLVVEDAAQALMSSWRNRPLGSFGELGALSFHETKNVTSGEGGALLINDPRFIARAEIIREKGTNRSQFKRGEVERYTWQDLGSSYCPSEIEAAFLMAQMEEAQSIRAQRLALWNAYHAALAPLEARERLRRPIVPANCSHNAHQYHILLPTAEKRERIQRQLRAEGIDSAFHFVPLHSSPMGSRIGRVSGPMTHTDALWQRLLRLPLWPGLDAHMDRVLAHVVAAVEA